MLRSTLFAESPGRQNLIGRIPFQFITTKDERVETIQRVGVRSFFCAKRLPAAPTPLHKRNQANGLIAPNIGGSFLGKAKCGFKWRGRRAQVKNYFSVENGMAVDFLGISAGLELNG